MKSDKYHYLIGCLFLIPGKTRIWNSREEVADYLQNVRRHTGQRHIPCRPNAHGRIVCQIFLDERRASEFRETFYCFGMEDAIYKPTCNEWQITR